MMDKEGIIRISTKSEEAKRTILDVIYKETGMKIDIPKGEMQLQQSVYDEIAVRIIQQIILNNEVSLVTLESLDKKGQSKKEKEEKDVKQENKTAKTRKKSGGRANKLLEKINACMETKKKVTMKDLVEYTGGSQCGIRRNLDKLVEEGKIVHIERGKWMIKKSDENCLDMPEYTDIINYIVEYGTFSREKVVEKFSEKEVNFVLKELESSSFIAKLDEDKYEVSLKFRIWYYIKQKPHVQWHTIRVDMGKKLIAADTLSATLNSLIRENKVKKMGIEAML